jgi:hypothetical protein
MDPQGTSFDTRAEFPSDISLLYALVTLVNEDGSPATITNGVYNHHIAIADISKSPVLLTSCPGEKPKPSLSISVFAGVGEDKGAYTYSTKDDKLNGGYYISKNDTVFLTAEFVNYTNDTKSLYAVVDVQYAPGKSNLDVTSETLSVTQCDGTGKGIGIRPDNKKVFGATSKNMTLQQDGYIFDVREFSY